ncbi:putative aldo keto reductase [Rosellinia necatrix]|uniref:Putative aldo keto reductase n=1 Tax=Rosellinia necatrix TaxID=77044 RepID=A0A1S7UMS0_ROSNE|nr:putative aldo keto reductase [Rosellinia necatrix]
MERITIGGDVLIPRIVSGLWQLAGQDAKIDLDAAARTMEKLTTSEFYCFDMADHYGDAELVVGRFHATSSRGLVAFTKWCPLENGVKSFEAAQNAVDLALQRMGQKQITLMQYHIWDYSDDTYWHNFVHLRTLQQQGKIKHIGVTNVDAAHLELLIDTGFKIATNQVSCSVLDQRIVRGRLASVCKKHKVGVLAYGTLLGGFLSDKWLDQPEPQAGGGLNPSLRKYLRFIRAAGGWGPFQGILRALSTIAQKYGVSIAAVATRYVLDIPVVSAVIVGCRLSAESSVYATKNLEAFSFSLTEDDHGLIKIAQRALVDIPGDCGDEYRRPPYLTAAGDLSDHMKEPRNEIIGRAIAEGKRIEYCTGSPWEPIAGYCRAVRTDNYIYVSGTTANCPMGISGIPALGGVSARSQTVAILDILNQAVKALGGTLSDVVRTRIMVRNEADCDEVSRAHGWVFECAGIRPSNTLFFAHLVGDEYLVEIESEVRLGYKEPLRLSR